MFDVFTPEEDASMAESTVNTVTFEPEGILCLLNEIDKSNKKAVLLGENPHKSLFGLQRATRSFVPYPERSNIHQPDGFVFNLRVSIFVILASLTFNDSEEIVVEQVPEKLAKNMQNSGIKLSTSSTVSVLKLLGATLVMQQSFSSVIELVKEAYGLYKIGIISSVHETLADQLLNCLWPAPLKYLVRIDGEGARWFHFNTMKSAKGVIYHHLLQGIHVPNYTHLPSIFL